MGTVGYMSPEQASGQAGGFPFRPVHAGLDPLRDGGRPPAVPASRRAAETMTAIHARGPRSRSSTAAPSAPPPYRWIVDRCLAKEPAEPVLVDAQDLAHELATLRDHLSEVARPRTGGRRVRRPHARAGAISGAGARGRQPRRAWPRAPGSHLSAGARASAGGRCPAIRYLTHSGRDGSPAGVAGWPNDGVQLRVATACSRIWLKELGGRGRGRADVGRGRLPPLLPGRRRRSCSTRSEQGRSDVSSPRSLRSAVSRAGWSTTCCRATGRRTVRQSRVRPLDQIAGGRDEHGRRGRRRQPTALGAREIARVRQRDAGSPALVARWPDDRALRRRRSWAAAIPPPIFVVGSGRERCTRARLGARSGRPALFGGLGRRRRNRLLAVGIGRRRADGERRRGSCVSTLRSPDTRACCCSWSPINSGALRPLWRRASWSFDGGSPAGEPRRRGRPAGRAAVGGAAVG